MLRVGDVFLITFDAVKKKKQSYLILLVNLCHVEDASHVTHVRILSSTTNSLVMLAIASALLELQAEEC